MCMIPTKWMSQLKSYFNKLIVYLLESSLCIINYPKIVAYSSSFVYLSFSVVVIKTIELIVT